MPRCKRPRCRASSHRRRDNAARSVRRTRATRRMPTQQCSSACWSTLAPRPIMSNGNEERGKREQCRLFVTLDWMVFPKAAVISFGEGGPCHPLGW
eukprot:1646744-Pyramimonas_sp.AAC.1